jgi:hypothetical protein
MSISGRMTDMVWLTSSGNTLAGGAALGADRGLDAGGQVGAGGGQ